MENFYSKKNREKIEKLLEDFDLLNILINLTNESPIEEDQIALLNFLIFLAHNDSRNLQKLKN